MINFNSGPAALPDQVLGEAADAINEYPGSGISLLGMPHRGKAFRAILEEANALVHDLLQLNDDYEVLWMQGGGRLQFSLIPMNFLGAADTAGYIDSGHWASEAVKNALFFGKANILASSRQEEYRSLPEIPAVPDDLSYLHLTTNNTIYGTQFKHFPQAAVPVIADMSSDLFSRAIDYSRFDMIYAVAQKNIGPAGVTLVVMRKELLQRQKRVLPGILSYQAIAAAHSVYNTPPVFAIYCCLLTLRWIAAQGLSVIEKRNKEKAKILYDAIDTSRLYSGIAARNSRSRMNVCFTTGDASRDRELIDYAAAHDITGIGGHRSIGGLRVALYNAITPEEVQQLAGVLAEFEANHS